MVARYISVLVSVFCLLVADSALAQDAGPEMSLHEKAIHHYDQLVRTLIKIKKNGLEDLPTSLIAGITSGGNDNNNNNLKGDISTWILRSLLSSCHSFQNIGQGSETNINIFNNATITFSSRDKKKKSDKGSMKDKGRKPTDGPPDSSEDVQPSSSPEFRTVTKSPENAAATAPTWLDNLVRPINFTLKREGQLVRVSFDVLRTEPSVVSHTWTFDGERKYLKGPTDYDLDAGLTISSPIDFLFNASSCPPKHPPPRREHFSFAMTKRSSSFDAVTFTVPTCILDVMNGMQENSDEEIKWNEPVDEYAQKLYYPDYWNKVNTSVLQQTMPGKNVSFDIQLALGKEDHFVVEGIIYNATSDSIFLPNSLFVQVSGASAELNVQYLDGPDQVKLLDVEILDQSRVNGSIPGIEYKGLSDDTDLFHVSATLRVTLMTAFEDVSGMLHMQHEFKLPLKSQERLSIMALTVLKAVRILRPDQTEAIPKGKYFTHTKNKFRCGDDSFSHYQGYGDNCTFFCSILGTDLKNIRVRKVKGSITPVQKYAEVNPHNAVLFVNLGPTRKEIDGEYECRAITVGGKRHKWKVTVGTWGFPKVMKTELDVRNETATFVCVVASERPVNVTTSLYRYVERESQRIDDKPDVTRMLKHNGGNETRMEVTLPASYLRWPNEFLACVAETEAGSDLSMESLNSYSLPDYYYQTDHPFLMRNESTATDHRDGSATVKCVATGKDPLEINFYFNPFSDEAESIKSNSMNTIIAKQDGDTVTAILKMPTVSLKWPRYTISCQAQNEYGKDSIDFQLSDFIEDYY